MRPGLNICNSIARGPRNYCTCYTPDGEERTCTGVWWWNDASTWTTYTFVYEIFDRHIDPKKEFVRLALQIIAPDWSRNKVFTITTDAAERRKYLSEMVDFWIQAEYVPEVPPPCLRSGAVRFEK